MSGVFYGWWIVLAVSLIHFWGAGTAFYSFTAFFNPMVAEFNWSYAGTSLAMSFRSMETGIAAPIVGTLTDRFGPRRLVFMGSILAGLCFVLLSRVNSLGGFYFYFILMSIGTSLCFTVPGYTAIANWFDKKRGIALGVSLAAIGVSGMLIPAMNWVIARYDWREAMVVGGVGMWVVGIPASLALRHRPEDYGYAVDGIGGGRQSGPASRVPLAEGALPFGFGTREAMKTGVFWLIAIGATVASAGISAVSVHVMPALISVQIARRTAASLSAIVIVSSAAGRLGFGWLSDRISKKYLFGVALLMEGAGLLVFANTHSLVQVVVFAVLFGPGYGGVAIMKLTMQGEYFGRRSFGSINGLLSGIHTVGTITGPVLAGLIYDARGSYSLAWLVLGVAILAAVPLLVTAGNPLGSRAQGAETP